MNVLLLAANPHLVGIARVPRALKESGFSVGALCVRTSFLAKTRHLDHCWYLRNFGQNPFFRSSTIRDLNRVITAFEPDLIIGCSERAILLLHFIARHRRPETLGLSTKAIGVIRASLGDPRHYEATTNKNATVRLASSIGVRVPKQIEVHNIEDALQAAATIGYPVMLKKAMGEAGNGVRLCRDAQTLTNHMRTGLFAAPSRFKRLLRRFLGRDVAWIPDNAAVAVQQFIQGDFAICCATAHRGKTLASITAIKEAILPNGNTARLRFEQHAEIEAAVGSLLQASGFTGFSEIEFVIDQETRHAYVMDWNARPTHISALGKKVGVDLCSALLASLQGSPAQPGHLQARTIALFPMEWLRDCHSQLLNSADHDVPWDDVELMRAMFNNAFPKA